MADDVPLIADPIYGLRTWRVINDGGAERLVAPQRGTPWVSAGEWMRASCTTGHAAPASDCQCGIHAWHPRLAAARRILASRFELPGLVEARGKIEVHSDGLRAERARPHAFVRLPGRNPHLIDRLARRYDAQVIDVRRPAELLAICRDRDLGLTARVVEQILGADVIRAEQQARHSHRRSEALRLAIAAALAAVLAATGIALDNAPAHNHRPPQPPTPSGPHR